MIRIIDIDTREVKNIVDHFDREIVAEREQGSVPSTVTIILVPGARLLSIGHAKSIKLRLDYQYYSLNVSKYYKIEIY